MVSGRTPSHAVVAGVYAMRLSRGRWERLDRRKVDAAVRRGPHMSALVPDTVDQIQAEARSEVQPGK